MPTFLTVASASTIAAGRLLLVLLLFESHACLPVFDAVTSDSTVRDESVPPAAEPREMDRRRERQVVKPAAAHRPARRLALRIVAALVVQLPAPRDADLHPVRPARSAVLDEALRAQKVQAMGARHVDAPHVARPAARAQATVDPLVGRYLHAIVEPPPRFEFCHPQHSSSISLFAVAVDVHFLVLQDLAVAHQLLDVGEDLRMPPRLLLELAVLSAVRLRVIQDRRGVAPMHHELV